MNYNDILVRVIYLTKRNNITQQNFADILNISRQSMNGRAERNSEFKDFEIKAIEEYYNINLSSVNISVDITRNSNKNISNKSLKDKLSGFPSRLIEIQKSSGLTDKDFAEKLDLYRNEYLEFKSGERKPDLNIINHLKQNFKISIDWLLYCE